MPSNKTWIVVGSGTEPLEQVSGELKKMGFSIQSSLDTIGQLIVEGSEEQAKQARQIKSIASITPSHADIDIGKPGEEISW